MKRIELERIIAEELIKSILELNLASSNVEEAKGQGKSGKYTSIGTVPKTFEPPRKVDAAERHKIGVTMMNLYARGNVRGTGGRKNQKSSRAISFRKAINKKVDNFLSQNASITPAQIEKIDDPKKRARLTTIYKAVKSGRKNDRRQIVNSFIWAAASNIAAKRKAKRGGKQATQGASTPASSGTPEKKSSEKKSAPRKSTKKVEKPTQSEKQA